MEITSLGNNTITVCPNPECDQVLTLKGAYNMDGLNSLFAQHLAENPPCQKYQDDLPSFDEIISGLHDHECVTGNCTCVCGCTEPTGCQLVFGVALCTSCQLDEARGGCCAEKKSAKQSEGRP